MKVLQISPHTTLLPRTGGQLRSHHIARRLEEVGFEVSRIAITWLTEHDRVDRREPIVNVGLSEFWSSDAYRATEAWMPYLHEYYFPAVLAESPNLIGELLDYIESEQPDVIFLEHPWMWPSIKNLPRVRSGEIRVIYSTQNVETALKRRMIADGRVAVPAHILDDIQELESDLVAAARATIACTEADADVFRAWGAREVVVANNGTLPKDRTTLQGALPAPLQLRHQFVFSVGSYYPPNINGFFTYVAPALCRLRPNKRIVIAGRMCETIAAQIQESPLREYVDGRLVSLGMVDDVALDALIANASALLLPIDYGGGSNVKTAEALVSGRPIIATQHAFRGFAGYEELPRVTIANTPSQFEAAIHDALSNTHARNDDVPLLPNLLWESTLEPVVQLIRSIADPSRDGVLTAV